MKPQRPDSAKSGRTRVTVDSELTKSKFSQTYSSGVTTIGDKNNDFHRYVAQKNKQPRFKKLLQATMPQIPQQIINTNQLSKLTSKPFDRKISKKVQENDDKKIQQDNKNNNQIKQNFKISKNFIDKSKQKFKVNNKEQSQKKAITSRSFETQKKSEQEIKKKTTQNKPTINLNGFTLNIPGRPPLTINKKKQQSIKQDNQRQKLIQQLQQYVKQVQKKNINNLPSIYQQFLDHNINNKNINFDNIQINNFQSPNQKDYSNLIKKILSNQQQLQLQEKQSKLNQSKRSINLSQIIDAKQQSQDINNSSALMSSMSVSDVRDRNAFITQILKGKRVTQDQINQIKSNNQIILKLIKLQGIKKQQQEYDEQIDKAQTSIKKKKNGKFIEKNIYQGGGQLFQQCSLLTQNQRQRLDNIINGIQIESPYKLTQLQSLISRRIDEGIKIHHKLFKTQQNINQQQNDIIFYEDTLPKDPQLRKNVQFKILKQKINSINSRLTNVNHVIINKSKIYNLINKYKDSVKPSFMSIKLVQEKNKQINMLADKFKQAESILMGVENQRSNVLKIIDELSQKYRTMQNDVLKLQKMDIQEIKRMQQQELQKKKKKIAQIQRQVNQFNNDVRGIENISQELKKKIDILDQIVGVNNQELKCEGYQEGQSIQDIDELITNKWQAGEQALRDIRSNNK